MSSNDDPFREYRYAEYGAYTPQQAPSNPWLALYQLSGGIIPWVLGAVVGIAATIATFLFLLLAFGAVEVNTVLSGGYFPIFWSLLAIIGLSLISGAVFTVVIRYALGRYLESALKEPEVDYRIL